jgi:hypothetical protein
MSHRSLDSRKAVTFAVVALMVLYFMISPAAAQKASDQSVGGAKKAAASTPHLADGHPDLNGYWDPGGAPANITQVGTVTKVFIGGGPAPQNAAAAAQPRRPAPNTPPYKPELEAKAKQLYDNQSSTDPAFFCKPLGIPRIGPPLQIVQSPNTIVFLYQPDAGAGDTGGITTRIIPTDGSPHRVNADPSFFGDAIGHWEGDTLVVDVNNFNEDTWLGNPGYFHSRDLHVVERLRREGDSLSYEATIEDPNVLTQPWVLSPRMLKLGKGVVEETPPCEERDQPHLVNTDHH